MLVLVLNPTMKLSHFKKYWKDVPIDIESSLENEVCSLFCDSMKALKRILQFEHEYKRLKAANTVTPSVERKQPSKISKFGGLLHRFLDSDSESEDEHENSPDLSKPWEQEPWLCEANESTQLVFYSGINSIP